MSVPSAEITDTHDVGGWETTVQSLSTTILAFFTGDSNFVFPAQRASVVT